MLYLSHNESLAADGCFILENKKSLLVGSTKHTAQQGSDKLLGRVGEQSGLGRAIPSAPTWGLPQMHASCTASKCDKTGM